MPRLRLLLVGRRRGALLAAARLDAEVLLLDDGPRPSRAAGVHAGARVDLDDLEACAEAARALIAGADGEGRMPDAVVAVIERAVMPAAAIRDALGIRGAGVERAAPWRDKVAMKDKIARAGVPCARSVAIAPGIDAAGLVEALGLPLVLKPRDASGGRGTTLCRDPREVREALGALREGMAESFVDGVELSVETFVHRGEVCFENITDYLHPRWTNIVPHVLPPDVDAAVRALNRAAIAALGITDGLTHLEAFVRGTEVVFGEVAVRPPGGYIMELLHMAYGFDPWRAHLEVELGRAPTVETRARGSVGVWLLHPPAGEVARVEGLEAARRVPGVVSVECALARGRRVSERLSSGQHYGRILVRTDDHTNTARALTAAHGCLRIETRRVLAA